MKFFSEVTKTHKRRLTQGLLGRIPEKVCCMQQDKKLASEGCKTRSKVADHLIKNLLKSLKFKKKKNVKKGLKLIYFQRKSVQSFNIDLSKEQCITLIQSCFDKGNSQG